jgi:hypothetical protein
MFYLIIIKNGDEVCVNRSNAIVNPYTDGMEIMCDNSYDMPTLNKRRVVGNISIKCSGFDDEKSALIYSDNLINTNSVV